MKPAWNGRFPSTAAAALVVLMVACQAAPPPPTAPAGATGPTGMAVGGTPGGDAARAGSGAAPEATAPAGAAGASSAIAVPSPSVPAPLPVSSAVARVPGASLPLAANVPTSVEPTSAFEVRIGVPLHGARLVLLDAQDAMVPSISDIEVGTETVITLVPDDVLRPGSTYLLRVEGLAGRLLPSDGGKTFEPAGFPLQTTGTPPPKGTPKKSAKRRRGG